MFNKITIVGVGLIGGSIGLAVKKKKLAKEVVGFFRRESSRQKALKCKAVDGTTLNLKEAVSGADIVIITTSVGRIIHLAKKCAKFMGKEAILTDVGSSKRHIVNAIEKFTSGKTNFIGSHPMAGSDKSGVENASPDIFKDAPVIITKTKNTRTRSLQDLKKFWQSLGSRTFVLSPARHDKEISLSSYLPHVVSYVLARSQTKDSVKLAGGSLRDTTRVSSSDPKLWKDIFLLSRKDVLRSISLFSQNLKKLKKTIKDKDAKGIERFLIEAKKNRKYMLKNQC